MNHAKYVLGLDFGARAGRALLVRINDGKEIATAVHKFAHGVISEKLPNGDSSVKLPAGCALQDPKDYLDVLKVAIPAVLREANARAEEVVGIGTAFTASTVLPVESDGTPLCFLPQWRANPHAWAKPPQHRAAQPQAAHITEVAGKRGEEFLKRYGGCYTGEWFFSKVLETVEKAPEVYDAADEFIEASDWIVWELVGRPRRNNCAAGFRAMWLKDKGGYPHYDFFKALHPKLEHVLDEKLGKLDIYPVGTNAGGLSRKAAALTGLKEGTPVAVGNMDAHAAAPACTVTEPGRLCLIMGAGLRHLLLARERREVNGVCGVVADGIVNGLWGYEAGRASGNDLFGWFFQNAVPAEVALEADRRGQSVPELLEDRAAALPPGGSGLLALDWRDGEPGVALVGAALPRPHEMFHALIEAAAFSTRRVVEAFAEAGVEVNELVTCGGLFAKNKLLLQTMSDVTGRPVKVAESSHATALGAAMLGAVVAGKDAGGYQNIQEAARHMARVRAEHYRPRKAAHETYGELYTEFVRLQEDFSRGSQPVLKTLQRLKTRHA